MRGLKVRVCGVGALLCATGIARAEPAGKTIAILTEGNDAEAVATGLAAHVRLPNKVSDPRAFRGALSTRGARVIGPASTNHARDVQLITRVHAAVTELHVDGAILVTLRKTKRGVQAHVWAVDAHGEGALVDKELPLPASVDANGEADAVWATVADLIPAPVEEPAPPPAPPPPPPPEASLQTTVGPAAADHGPTPAAPVGQAGSPRAHALLVVQAAIEAGSRHFSYVDRITPTLRPYDLFAAPIVSLAAEVYPLARAHIPIVNGLGATVDYARAFGLTSADAGGGSVGTTWQAFDVGIRERIALGRLVIVGIDAGYGAVDFTFDQGAFSSGTLPSVGYRFVRAGADARFNLGDFSLFGGAAYLPVLSTGGEGQLFARESVGGVEARLGAAYAIGHSFELSLGLHYTRFFYSMNPVPGDANVAGGALDELARLSLGFAYLL
jgi:hypothetical protein